MKFILRKKLVLLKDILIFIQIYLLKIFTLAKTERSRMTTCQSETTKKNRKNK
jgi:hypothetical protein